MDELWEKREKLVTYWANRPDPELRGRLTKETVAAFDATAEAVEKLFDDLTRGYFRWELENGPFSEEDECGTTQDAGRHMRWAARRVKDVINERLIDAYEVELYEQEDGTMKVDVEGEAWYLNFPLPYPAKARHTIEGVLDCDRKEVETYLEEMGIGYEEG